MLCRVRSFQSYTRERPFGGCGSAGDRLTAGDHTQAIGRGLLDLVMAGPQRGRGLVMRAISSASASRQSSRTFCTVPCASEASAFT